MYCAAKSVTSKLTTALPRKQSPLERLTGLREVIRRHQVESNGRDAILIPCFKYQNVVVYLIGVLI